MIWKPHVTVAAVIEREGRFLLVEEETQQGLQFNQPAGHLDEFESLIDAAVRETREETAHDFTPTALVGVYQWRCLDNDATYLRFAFSGTVTGPTPGVALDAGIVRAVWMTSEEIEATRARHRSPLLVACVRDYLAGRRFPLDLIADY